MFLMTLFGILKIVLLLILINLQSEQYDTYFVIGLPVFFLLLRVEAVISFNLLAASNCPATLTFDERSLVLPN